MATALDSNAEIPPDIQRLADLVDELARGLKRLNGGSAVTLLPPSPPNQTLPDHVLCWYIREYLRARLKRNLFFPEDLFADPAWDIILDLFASKIEGRSVSVSSACIAAQVPQTTALRWLARLEEADLVLRRDDAHDRRRAWVQLTLRGEKLTRQWALTTLRPLLMVHQPTA